MHLKHKLLRVWSLWHDHPPPHSIWKPMVSTGIKDRHFEILLHNNLFIVIQLLVNLQITVLRCLFSLLMHTIAMIFYIIFCGYDFNKFRCFLYALITTRITTLFANPKVKLYYCVCLSAAAYVFCVCVFFFALLPLYCFLWFSQLRIWTIWFQKRFGLKYSFDFS